MAFDKTLSIAHLDTDERMGIVEMYVVSDCCCAWGIFREHIEQEHSKFYREVESAQTVGDLYSLVNRYI